MRNSYRGSDYRESHGLRYTNIYHVWLQINQRYNNPKNKSYSDYGGRGILVCDKWMASFIDFYNDMSTGYTYGLQIDRINNDGPYSLENCRWVAMNKNMANRRNFGKYLKGVVGRTTGGKYISRITIDKAKYTIGHYLSEQDANSAFVIVHKDWYGF